MPVADQSTYLRDIIRILQTHWPENRCVNIVAHGHSVPSGYFATPAVHTFEAYPHLLHLALKQRFPYAVINMICTAIGGEHAQSGAARFKQEVLCHRPDVLLIDYALNDRRLGLETASLSWDSMIEEALEKEIKVILLTPTWDLTQLPEANDEDRQCLREHAEQVRQKATHYQCALVDSFAAFEHATQTTPLNHFLSWSNHPNAAGHQLVADALAQWFPPYVLEEP